MILQRQSNNNNDITTTNNRTGNSCGESTRKRRRRRNTGIHFHTTTRNTYNEWRMTNVGIFAAMVIMTIIIVFSSISSNTPTCAHHDDTTTLTHGFYWMVSSWQPQPVAVVVRSSMYRNRRTGGSSSCRHHEGGGGGDTTAIASRIRYTHHSHHPTNKPPKTILYYSRHCLSPTVLDTKTSMALTTRPTKYVSELTMTLSSLSSSNTDSSSTSRIESGDVNNNHNSTTTATTIDSSSSSTTLHSIPQRIRQQLNDKSTIFSNIFKSTLRSIYRVINQSIVLQFVLMISLYIFHLTILSQRMAILCWNTIAVGYDSLIGGIICFLYCATRLLVQDPKRRQEQQSFPWNLPRPQPMDHSIATLHSVNGKSIAIDTTIDQQQYDAAIVYNNNNETVSASSLHDDDTNVRNKLTRYVSNWFSTLQQQRSLTSNNTVPSRNTIDFTWIRFRISMIVTCGALMKAYFQTGTYSLFWEDLLYTMSAAGWPLTIPLSRSIQVLAGHLTWVTAGSIILWAVPRPPPFFQQQQQAPLPRTIPTQTPSMISSSANNKKETESVAVAITTYQWFRMSLRNCNWLWWTIGGYYVSSWLFNVADVLNRSILPIQVLQDATESVVTQLVQPEQNDIVASIIGYIAPCITAPVWEELLYRGFLLAGLTAWTGSYHVSCIVQAVIFSAHHMSITAAIPLAVLGYTWAVLYTQSKNLWTVIAVHAMWNSRVFLGSWFGL